MSVPDLLFVSNNINSWKLMCHINSLLKYLFAGVSNITDSRFMITATLIDCLRESSDEELGALYDRKAPSRFFSVFQMLGSAGADAGQSEKAAGKEEVRR